MNRSPDAARRQIVAGRIGLLLAAGRGARFDPTGRADKLLAAIDGRAAVLHALGALQESVERVIAVVRPDARGMRTAALLRQAGAEVTVCATADAGMGHSLAWAAQQALALEWPPDRVVVALGDMPFVRADTVARVAAAVGTADGIAAPFFEGRRGHPVAFGAAHLPALSRLSGDRGAAELLRHHPVTPVEVDDAGVLRDIDTPDDLARPLTGR